MGDTGLNTGGMGAYAPTKLVSASMLAEYEESIVRPTLEGLKKKEWILGEHSTSVLC